MAVINIKQNSNGTLNTYNARGAQYTGEKFGGELAGMTRYGIDPNALLVRSYDKVAERCVTLYNTSPFAKAIVNKPLFYSVGDGVVFKSEPNYRLLGWTQEFATGWARRFSELVHYNKLALSYYNKQSLLVRESKIAGDSVLIFLRGDQAAPGMPFDLVTATGYTIDSTRNEADFTLGIKADQYNRRSGFAVRGTNQMVPFMDPSGARNAVQMYYQERPGQLRGYSAFMGEISRIKSFDRIWDSVGARMEAEANIYAYSNETTSDIEALMGNLAGSGVVQPSGSTVTGGDTAAAGLSVNSVKQNYGRPGGVLHLDSDEKLNFLEMKTPSNNFATANEWSVNLSGMTSGYAPEFLLGKYSTSFTAHKGALNDTWKAIMRDRGQMVKTVDTPVNQELLTHFIQTGQIEAPPGYFVNRVSQMAALSGSNLGPVPGHVSPLQEVNADLKAVNGGLVPHADMMHKYGHDFENVIGIMGEQNEQWAEASPAHKAALLEEESQA